MALANGPPTDEEAGRLQKLAPAGVSVESVLVAESSDTVLARFQEAQRTRRSKLSASELHHITAGLVDMATFAGRITEQKLMRLHRLGRELNLSSQAVELMISKQSRKG